jgi:hypothetical protein
MSVNFTSPSQPRGFAGLRKVEAAFTLYAEISLAFTGI